MTQEYLDLVNELLPKTSAEGAYCIGIVSAFAWAKEMEPDRVLLKAAGECKTIREAIDTFQLWLPMPVRGGSARGA